MAFVPGGSTLAPRRRPSCSRSSRRTRSSGSTRHPVEVEVDVSSATMPKTVLVGLAEAAVRESTHRVERALVNSGYRRPTDRVVDQPRPRRPEEGRRRVRPADRPGDAPAASGQVAFERQGDFAVVGELALDGETRPIKGVLAMALAAAERKKADGSWSPRPTPPRPPSSRGSTSTRSGAWPRPSGFLSGQLDLDPRSVDLERGLPAATRTSRKTSSTSRGRTTPSGPW